MNRKNPLVYLRTFWVYLNAAFFLLILWPYLWYCERHHKSDYQQFEKKLFPLVHFVASRVLKLTGSSYWTKGIENIPKNGPVLLVGNHQSHFDIVLLLATVPRITGFLAKTELNKVPLLNRWIVGIGSTYIDREGGRKSLEAIIRSANHLKKNNSAMTVFPEGTRSADGQVHHFKPGALKIAERSSATIVPFVIHDTRKLMTKGSLLMYPQRIGVEFLAPIIINSGEKIDTVKVAEQIESEVRKRSLTGEEDES